MVKIGESPESVVAITTEQAISIFEATVFEQLRKVSASYNAIYQSVKKSFFQNIKDNKVDKSKREAMDKINAMINISGEIEMGSEVLILSEEIL